MDFISKYQKILYPALEQVSFPNTPSNLYEPLDYFLQLGGKRMRPLLTLIGCEMFNQNAKNAIQAALAVELFHNFTLIHDDIMDEAPLRRNQPTVHQKWNSNIAILSGDVLLVRAYEQLAHYSPTVFQELFNTFNKTAIEVCEGQQLDMDFEKRDTVSIEEYIEMIRLKTSVLLGAALKMGGQVAGTSKENIELLYEFGVNTGIAFQLQDDWLDLYADPEKFGKQIGGDIIANKKTFLLIQAKTLANDSQSKKLQDILSHSNNYEKVEMARELFDHLGIEEKIKAEMNNYYSKAKESLAAIHLPNSSKEDLLALGDYLLKREV